MRGPGVLILGDLLLPCGSVGQIAGARSCLGKVKISIARAHADPVRMQPLHDGGGGTQVRQGGGDCSLLRAHVTTIIVNHHRVVRWQPVSATNREYDWYQSFLLAPFGQRVNKLHSYFVRIGNIHGKNDFVKVTENLTRYKCENNSVGLSKYLII